MKRFLLLFGLFLGTLSSVFAGEVTFDFVHNEYGLTRSATTYESAYTFSIDPVTIEYKKVSGSGLRLWTDGLRVYKGEGTFTFSVPEGNKITKIVITDAKAIPTTFIPQGASNNANTEHTWEGDVNQVVATMKPTANNAIATIQIVYSGAEAPVLTPANLSFPEKEYTANVGESFTAPKLSKDTDAPVTYTSSDEAVATVDAETGEITIVGVGNTTITATAEATEEYAAGSASYELTVVDPNALEVTFDFLKYDYGLPNDGNTYVPCPSTISNNQVSIILNAGTGANSFRYWSDGLRWYKGSPSITISVPGYIITEINITTKATATVIFDGNTSVSGTPHEWNGSASEVNATFNETGAITSVLVKYTPAGDPSKENVELSFPESAYTALYPGTFEAPELTKSADVAVSYTSSNEAVATVDATTGAVTIVGAGTTTITATSEETDEYNSATATYTLTVEQSSNSIKDIIAADGKDCLVNFSMTVTYVNGRYVYVYDGVNYGLIYANDADHLYTEGSVIPAGWSGKYSDYNGLAEIVPVGALPVSAETAAVPAVEMVEAVNVDMVNTIVVLKGVEFATATEGPAAKAQNFTGTVGETSYTFRNTFNIESVDAGTYDVKLAVSYYGTAVQLLPIAYEKVVTTPLEYIIMLDGEPVEVSIDYDEDLEMKMGYMSAFVGQTLSVTTNREDVIAMIMDAPMVMAEGAEALPGTTTFDEEGMFAYMVVLLTPDENEEEGYAQVDAFTLMVNVTMPATPEVIAEFEHTLHRDADDKAYNAFNINFMLDDNGVGADHYTLSLNGNLIDNNVVADDFVEIEYVPYQPSYDLVFNAINAEGRVISTYTHTVSHALDIENSIPVALEQGFYYNPATATNGTIDINLRISFDIDEYDKGYEYYFGVEGDNSNITWDGEGMKDMTIHGFTTAEYFNGRVTLTTTEHPAVDAKVYTVFPMAHKEIEVIDETANPARRKVNSKQDVVTSTVNSASISEPIEVVADSGTVTGIENVIVEDAAEAVYFDMTGRRVAKPANGMYIRVVNGKATKVAIR